MNSVRRQHALLRNMLLAGMAFVVAILAAPAEAGERLPHAASRIAQAHDPYGNHIAEASRRFGVPQSWIRAVMHAESRSRPGAVSSAGAMGLMQIMPKTWEELRARHRLGPDPFEPRDNIFAGVAYLRELHTRFGSPGFLAAYNAGPGRYTEYLERGRPLPPETSAYVAAIAPQLGSSGAKLPLAGRRKSASDWSDAPLFVGKPEARPDASSPAGSKGLFVTSPSSAMEP